MTEYASMILTAINNNQPIEYFHSGTYWQHISSSNALKVIEEGHAANLRIYKPETIMMNGHVVSTPESEPLQDGQLYWIVSRSHQIYMHIWRNDYADSSWLREGVVHLSKEAAIFHRDALLAFTRATTAL